MTLEVKRDSGAGNERLTRLRAREQPPCGTSSSTLVARLATASASDARAIAAALRVAANRARWRDAVARKNSRIARALKALELAIISYSGRSRGAQRTWVLRACPVGDEVDVAVLWVGKASSLCDLGLEIDVDLLRPDLVRVSLLPPDLRLRPRPHRRRHPRH